MTPNERNTLEREGIQFAYEMAAGAAVTKGTIVMLDAGFAKTGSAIAAAIPVGIAAETVSNAAGAAGAARVNVRAGTFLLANSAGADEITRADIGKSAYVADNETVAKTNGGGTRPVAGRIRAVEANGVWVTF